MLAPLEITAYLAGGIALSRPEDLALDGILTAQVLRRHFGEEFYYLPNPKECLYFARLPLEMRGSPSPQIIASTTGDKWIVPHEGLYDESLWYWSCSSAQIDVKARDTHYWNKRFDTQASLSDHIDFGGRVEKIIIEQGQYKAYHMPLPTLITNKIMWYAYGDREAMTDLLSPVMGIGKKRAQGEGHVLRWGIEEITDDCSTWKENCLMRPLPGPLAQDILWQETPNIRHIAFRAPQWHPMNQVMCAVGGKRHA